MTYENVAYSSHWHFDNLYHINSFNVHILSIKFNHFFFKFWRNSSTLDSTRFKIVPKSSIYRSQTMAKSSVSMVQLLTSQWQDQWMVKQSSILGISLIQSINGHRLSTLLMAHLTHFIMTLLKPHSWHSRIYAHFCSVWHLHMTPMHCSNVTSQHIPAALPKSGMLIWIKSKPCRQPEKCDKCV